MFLCATVFILPTTLAASEYDEDINDVVGVIYHLAWVEADIGQQRFENPDGDAWAIVNLIWWKVTFYEKESDYGYMDCYYYSSCMLHHKITQTPYFSYVEAHIHYDGGPGP